MADREEGADGGAEEKLSYDDDLLKDVQAAFDASQGAADDKGQAEAAAAEEPGERSDQRTRDDKGRFAKTQEEKAAEVDATAQQGAQGQQPEQQVQQAQQAAATQQVAAAPPVGWSVKSKGEWDRLPDHIRADIAKREEEVSKGFQQYAGLGRFREMAERSGTTLERALEAYTGIDQQLRQSPVDAFIKIAQNIRVHPVEIAQQIMSAYGRGAQPQLQPDAQAQDIAELYPELAQVINPLQQQVQQLTQQTQQFLSASQQREKQEQERILSANEAARVAFANDPKNRYYGNVEPTILRLLQGGLVQITGNPTADLAKAYDMACQLDPDVRAQLTQESAARMEQDKQAKEREAAAKARNASRQITGSAPSVDAPLRKKRDGMSYEDDLYEDVRAAMGNAAGRV